MHHACARGWRIVPPGLWLKAETSFCQGIPWSLSSYGAGTLLLDIDVSSKQVHLSNEAHLRLAGFIGVN